jgi:hypothetical protein
MIREYDMVKAIKDLSGKVKVGSEGTVLMIYPDFPYVYEIEFFDKMKESLDVLTVQADDIIKLSSPR